MTSEAVCELFHNAMRMLARCSVSEPPVGLANGVYVIFQPDEMGHSEDRIVRIGSHTGEGNLPARLREHMTENKDRSILRKHIGRAILRQTGDPYSAIWNLDYTPTEVREVKGHLLDPVKQAKIEAAVSEYISRFSVSMLPMGSIPPRGSPVGTALHWNCVLLRDVWSFARLAGRFCRSPYSTMWFVAAHAPEEGRC